MKMIFEKKKYILQGNYTRNSLLPKCHVKRRRPPTSCSQRSQTRILPISFLRAFISSFLFRGFSLNVETASHYRSFVARDVNKRGTSKREVVHRPSSDSSRGIDYPSRNCFSFSRNRCCYD